MKIFFLIPLMLILNSSANAGFFKVKNTNVFLNSFDEDIKMKFESDRTLEDISFRPSLSCSSVEHIGGGNFSTTSVMSDLAIQFTQTASENSDILSFLVTNSEKYSLVSPELATAVGTHCNFSVSLNLTDKELGEVLFSNYIDIRVRKKGSQNDITDQVYNNLSGNYLIKKIYAGTIYSTVKNKRVPVCNLGLFKNGNLLSASVFELTENCEGVELPEEVL